jgi:hypothetical protein
MVEWEHRFKHTNFRKKIIEVRTCEYNDTLFANNMSMTHAIYIFKRDFNLTLYR